MPKLHILGGGVVELRQPLHPETHQNVRLVVDNDAADDVDTDWLADQMRFVPEVPAEPAEWHDVEPPIDFEAIEGDAD